MNASVQIQKMLTRIERAGNALPHPATLFVLLTAAVMVISWLLAALDVSVLHPVSKAVVPVDNLLSQANLQRLLTSLVSNFTGFAPLGTVLVAMLGIAVAEGSGLISTALRALLVNAPPRAITFVVVFAGLLSHVASDAGYVLVIPLGAIIFAAAGRHPLAGLAAAFAGVSGGFSANLLIGPLDPMLAGLTQEAARLVDPQRSVNPAANYYFMAASTFLIAGVASWVTETLVEPRLGVYVQDVAPGELQGLSLQEKRALRYSGLSLLVFVGVIVAGLLPADGFLQNPQQPGWLHSPVVTSIVAVIFIAATLAGLVYGFTVGTFRNDHDVIKAMENTMSTMGLYIVLAFFTAQFISCFAWSNLGLVSAVNGAEWLSSLGVGAVPLMMGLIVFTVLLDLLIGSASAKWAVMASIFVPMFMLLGYPPELTQAAYRIGDSVANIITPLMPYFPLVVAFAQKYDKQAGIGTVIALMLPYSLLFLVSWSSLLVLWIVAGWPLGLMG